MEDTAVAAAAAAVADWVTRAPKPATASWATRCTARAAASSPGWAYSSTSRAIAAVMSSASEPSAGSSQAAASPETPGQSAEITSAYCSTPVMLLAGNASVTCQRRAGDTPVTRRCHASFCWSVIITVRSSLTTVSRHDIDADL